jgi:exodeoxyribonuclease VII small subunit
MVEEGIAQDIARMNFEDAFAELEAIVRRLEEGSSKLDEAIAAYERGVALKRHCEAKLQEAQSKVEKIVLEPNGQVAAKPIDLD